MTKMVKESIYDQLEPLIYELITKKVKDAEVILEVGCGNCRLTNFLAQRTGHGVVGIDITDEGFIRGREDAEKLGIVGLVRYMKGDAENLSFLPVRKFDAVVSMYVLHELEQPLRVLREVKKVLRNGGKVIVVDFPKGSIAQNIWGEKYYTPQEIENLFKEAGFNQLKIEFLAGQELVFVTGSS
jgi:ubiquinone/menaquinone biosynthesis C-methylase UbiE